jgi:adenosylhomocysteine nucleosidase
MATERTEFHKKMLILMALPQESQGLIEPWAEQRQTPLVYTGMGMVNAAAKTTEAILKYQPDFVLNLGTGGSRKFKIGEVVECVEFIRRDQVISFLNRKIKISNFTKLKSTNCGTADFVDGTDYIE